MEQLCQFACDCDINSKMIKNELLIFKKIKETELNTCADREHSPLVKIKLKDVCFTQRFQWTDFWHKREDWLVVRYAETLNSRGYK